MWQQIEAEAISISGLFLRCELSSSFSLFILFNKTFFQVPLAPSDLPPQTYIVPLITFTTKWLSENSYSCTFSHRMHSLASRWITSVCSCIQRCHTHSFFIQDVQAITRTKSLFASSKPTFSVRLVMASCVFFMCSGMIVSMYYSVISTRHSNHTVAHKVSETIAITALHHRVPLIAPRCTCSCLSSDFLLNPTVTSPSLVHLHQQRPDASSYFGGARFGTS